MDWTNSFLLEDTKSKRRDFLFLTLTDSSHQLYQLSIQIATYFTNFEYVSWIKENRPLKWMLQWIRTESVLSFQLQYFSLWEADRVYLHAGFQGSLYRLLIWPFNAQILNWCLSFFKYQKKLNIHFDSLQLLRYKYVKWREFINNNDRFGM